MKLTANDLITLKRLQDTQEMVVEINQLMADHIAAHERRKKK